jgi:predicted TIM-barrel fold metal-dependent hydrolase
MNPSLTPHRARRPTGASLLGLILVGLTAACGPTDAPNSSLEDGGDPPRPPGVPGSDNHTHIQSPAGAEVLAQLMEMVGQGDPETAAPITADELIAALDEAGIRKAQVLSAAYFFGFPGIEFEDEEARVRRENDYVASEAARFPDRLVAACSINPLSNYAPAEVLRCANNRRVAGLKLHLANSDVDLRDFDHRQRLGRVFDIAEANGFPVLIHMRTRNPEYGAEDVNFFIDEVLSRAPTLPVQIAHMAGWGGYDQNTINALEAWISAFEEGRANRELYTFDLSAVAYTVPDSALAEVPFDPHAPKPELRDQILRLGPERVLFASDWSSITPGATLDGVRNQIALPDSVLEVILGNEGPLLARMGARGVGGTATGPSDR